MSRAVDVDIPVPPGWVLVERRDDGIACQNLRRGLRVIASVAIEADGKRWLHISVSKANSMPLYPDLREVKNAFVGQDKPAYQVMPPESEYVNIHPFCMHLWHCLDGEPIPRFAVSVGGTMTI